MLLKSDFMEFKKKDDIKEQHLAERSEIRGKASITDRAERLQWTEDHVLDK